MPYLDLDNDDRSAGDDDAVEPFRLYYEVHGPAPGPGVPTPILLAHGAGGNAFSWWQQVPVLAERYPVVTFDHRGFGRSVDAKDGPGRLGFASDVRRLLDHLGIGRVHFVAHSMGARTAFGLLSRDPGRIASLTYSGTNGGSIDDRYRELRSRLEADGTLGGSLLSRALGAGYGDEAPAMRHLYMRIRSLNPTREAAFLHPSGRLPTGRGSTAQRLNDSGLPILWVVGDRDRVVHPDLIRISHELTPGSRFALVEGAGHSAYFERAEAWNAAVLGFIDGVETQTA